MHLIKIALLIAATTLATGALAACGGDETWPDSLYEHWTGEPDSWQTLTVFTDSHGLLDEEKVWEACLQWMPKGVICDLVDSPSQADVTIQASDKPCDKNEDGLYTIGWASSNGVTGHVTLMAACPGWDDSQVIGVLTHEIGHVIGIWKHIPPNCDEPHLTHPNGQDICGTAIMNPVHKPGLDYTTLIDGLAFDLRDSRYSLLRPFGQSQTFYYGPPSPNGAAIRVDPNGELRCDSH